MATEGRPGAVARALRGSAPNAFSATSHATLVKCTFRIYGGIPPSAHDHGFGVAANTCPPESVRLRMVERKRFFRASYASATARDFGSEVSASVLPSEIVAYDSAYALRRLQCVSTGDVLVSPSQPASQIEGRLKQPPR